MGYIGSENRLGIMLFGRNLGNVEETEPRLVTFSLPEFLYSEPRT